MDWSSLPPLSALKAFGVVAETNSLSKAGAVLNVSHAAISQHIRNLEAHLGTKLVERSGRGVALTHTGTKLALDIRSGFETIGGAIDALVQDDRARAVQVSMTPVFAAAWLMPRIADFQQAHPDIELMLNPTADVVPIEPGGVDVAIRFGSGNWSGLSAEMLFPTGFVIVGSPDLVGDANNLSHDDLAGFPWLEETGTHEVTSWLESQGIAPRENLKINQYPGYMVLNAVRNGAGVSATAEIFVREDIREGRLVVLHDDTPPSTGYHIVTQKGVIRDNVKSFISWIRRQAKVER